MHYKNEWGDSIKLKKRQNLAFGISIVFLLILLVVSLMVFRACSGSGDSNGQITVPDTPCDDGNEIAAANSCGTIAIPGYEALMLKSDERKQKISFRNPEQNKCYFVISLYLSDGTLLWVSDYVKPGAVSKEVVLTQALSRGTYGDCVLKYDCYSYDSSKKQLNGAETKVALIVK